MNLDNEDIRLMRMSIGKFLHDYYVKFGEEKYETFIDKLGTNMSLEYGDPFTSDNLRIMEAEYVTLTARIDEKAKLKTKKHLA